jgi:ribosomal protein L31
MKSNIKKVYVQFTDGSIFLTKSFSKNVILKLAVDAKSHKLWRSFFSVKESFKMTNQHVFSFNKKFLNK